MDLMNPQVLFGTIPIGTRRWLANSLALESLASGTSIPSKLPFGIGSAMRGDRFATSCFGNGNSCCLRKVGGSLSGFRILIRRAQIVLTIRRDLLITITFTLNHTLQTILLMLSECCTGRSATFVLGR